MNLQESIRRILREETSNRSYNKLIDMIKTIGFDKTSNVVGGIDNLKKITEIYNSYQFMKLFLDLKPKKSEDEPDTILFKNDEGTNVFVYHNQHDVYFFYDLIYNPLDQFKETQRHDERFEFLQKWLKDNYKINVNVSDIYSYRHPDYLIYLN